MADDRAENRAASSDYPVSEDADSSRYRVAETASTFVHRPSSDAEAAMLREIDAIQDRLRVGVAPLHREMDALLARINTPL